MRTTSLVVLAAVSVAFASPVFADPGQGHGQGRENGPPDDWGGRPGQLSPQVNIVISPNDRTT